MKRPPPDMSVSAFRSAGHALIEQIADFYESLPSRKLTSAKTVDGVREAMGIRPLPEQGTDPADLLPKVGELLFDNSLHNGHPKFLGYITSSAGPLGALADLLASALNSNIAKWELAPIASEIETQVIGWLADLIGYDADCDGIMVSGGNMANFTAFVAARRAMLPWDVRKDGNYGDHPRPVAYVSGEAHTWVQKAADVCGLGQDAIRWVRTDEAGRMDVGALRESVASDRAEGRVPFMVVGTAGAGGTGVIDPLTDIAEFCAQESLWFHVDGAYGGPAACLPEGPEELRAIAVADSVAIDPHKWLYCPLEAAVVLTRHKNALAEAFSFRPTYYHFADEASIGKEYYEHGMQNSRGFRALKVWLMLQQAGREGYRASIRRDIALAQRLYDRAVEHPELEANSRHLSIATLRYVPEGVDTGDSPELVDELNKRLLARLQKNGDAFLSNAVAGGKYLLRGCVVNFRTTERDIDEIVDLIVAEGRRLTAEYGALERTQTA